jgi:putative oxidoreductase
MDPAQFARIIYNYHLLPGNLINLAAIIMPWVEFICGVALILGIYRGGATLVLNTLLVVFLIAIVVNLVRGVNLECGCFSVSSKAKSSAWNLIFRDIGYLIVGLYVYFNKSTRFSLGKARY